jgi:hypothetical protein
MNKTYATLAALTTVALLGLGACATTADEKTEVKVEKAVQAEPSANQPGEIAVRGEEAFLKAPGLTEAQRMKLMEIHKKAYAESMSIRDELGKAKSALFKTLVDPKASAKELSLLKKKITALDKKRLTAMFTALDEAQKVLGKTAQAESVYREFYQMDLMNKADRNQY